MKIRTKRTDKLRTRSIYNRENIQNLRKTQGGEDKVVAEDVEASESKAYAHRLSAENFQKLPKFQAK